MSIPTEIRQILFNAGGVLHIENIRMMALSNRVEGKKPQCLKTFTNAVYAMEDVEFIELDGLKGYVVFKSQAKHSMSYHISGIIRIVKERVRKCLLDLKRLKLPTKKLEKAKSYMLKMLARFGK